MPTTADLQQVLRGAALRVTRPRLAVLTRCTTTRTPTPRRSSARRGRPGEVSHQAVYDVLRALTAAGLVRRIQPAGSVARYEARVGDNHHHVGVPELRRDRRRRLRRRPRAVPDRRRLDATRSTRPR